MARQVNDLTSLVFGRWIVLRRDLSNMRPTRWICKCSCSKEKSVLASNLCNGQSVSCGCYSQELHTLHGLGETRIRSIWSGMLRRCYETIHKKFCIYGARGINVCDAWRQPVDGLIAFAQWFYKQPGSDDDSLQLDSIDNNGEYSPENCRLVTRKENNRNKRTNRLVSVGGRALAPLICVLENPETNPHALQYGTVSSRLRAGLDVDSALSTPARFINPKGYGSRQAQIREKKREEKLLAKGMR